MIVELIILCISFIIFIALCLPKKYTGGGPQPKRQKEFDFWSHTATEKFISSVGELIAEVITGVDPIMNFDNITKTQKYISTKSIIKPVLHNGQVKLFLTELRFLTESITKPAFVVYAGSAPSNKLQYLSSLFPQVVFVCVDPNEHLIMYPGNKSHYDHNDTLYFCANQHSQFGTENATWWDNGIKTGKRHEVPVGCPDIDLAGIIAERKFKFYIIEDYFTDHLAQMLKPLNCYFISDIRSQFSSDESPRDIDILWNSAMMYNWLAILQPQRYMLKFRTPYSFTADIAADWQLATYTHDDCNNCPISFIENYKSGKFIYIKPEVVYMQAFAGATSTESRLVGSSLNLQEWNVPDYNDKFFYYNRIYRTYGWHNLPTDTTLGVDHCGDCAIMMTTFAAYCDKYGGRPMTMVGELLRVCRRNLFDNSTHGRYFYQPKNVGDLIKMQKNLYKATVAQMVLTLPKDFTPMSIGQAYLYYKALAVGTQRAVIHHLIAAWLFGWNSKLANNYICAKLDESGIDFAELQAAMLNPPPVEVKIDGDNITANEFTFALQKMDTTTQLIGYLTGSVPTNIVIPFDISEYKIIARNSMCVINGRQPDFNIFVDCIAKLPKGKYFVYVPNMSQFGRQVFANRHTVFLTTAKNRESRLAEKGKTIILDGESNGAAKQFALTGMF